MNPAALKANIDELERGATIIANEDAFTTRNLQKAGYDGNPLEDGSLRGFVVHRIPMNTLTQRAVEGMEEVSTRDALRAKNLFALGLLSWLYDRPTALTEAWMEKRFAGRKASLEANLAAFRAGWSFGETTELIDVQIRVPAAHDMEPGTYRTVNGTTATALGLIAASVQSGLQLVLASYPITPASELLHELARHRRAGVRTIQAEDEIAAAGMALGAAFGGALGVTATSGPGMDLKAETVGLAVMLELPMLVIDVQRAGPSTGMPTKTEQSDLLMALYGRHGESPLPIVCATTPAQCFTAVLDAVRIAVRYRTPVILLTDLFLANSSEPWLIPDVTLLPPIAPDFAAANGHAFEAYARNADGARPWAVPGTPGLEHRIGGLSSEDLTGNVSYPPANNELMVRTRVRKIAGIAREIPPTEIFGDQDGGDLLVLAWGSTFGPIREAVKQMRAKGRNVSHIHLRYLNPLPSDLAEKLRMFRKVMVAEMNMGQLLKMVRADYLIDAVGCNKVQGRPFKVSELTNRVTRALEG